MYVCMYIFHEIFYVFTHSCIRPCANLCVRVSIYMCILMYACICICVCIYIYTHIHIVKVCFRCHYFFFMLSAREIIRLIHVFFQLNRDFECHFGPSQPHVSHRLLNHTNACKRLSHDNPNACKRLSHDNPNACKRLSLDNPNACKRSVKSSRLTAGVQ